MSRPGVKESDLMAGQSLNACLGGNRTQRYFGPSLGESITSSSERHNIVGICEVVAVFLCSYGEHSRLVYGITPYPTARVRAQDSRAFRHVTRLVLDTDSLAMYISVSFAIVVDVLLNQTQRPDHRGVSERC